MGRRSVRLCSLSDDQLRRLFAAHCLQYKGYESRFRYIATQGPIDETIDDFWQMVWEQVWPHNNHTACCMLPRTHW